MPIGKHLRSASGDVSCEFVVRLTGKMKLLNFLSTGDNVCKQFAP